MNYRFVRVATWPGERKRPRERRRAPFSAAHTRTLTDLARELEHLGARQVVIQTYHAESELRLDGLPRASARAPEDPGVVLTFATSTGTYSYPCDTFDDWRGNLRAIVLTLEKLRAIDRYGVTKRGEQYTGWKALPPAKPASSREAAAIFLSRVSGYSEAEILGSTVVRDAAYKAAAAKLHPDTGGSHEAFVRLQDAARALGRP